MADLNESKLLSLLACFCSIKIAPDPDNGSPTWGQLAMTNNGLNSAVLAVIATTSANNAMSQARIEGELQGENAGLREWVRELQGALARREEGYNDLVGKYNEVVRQTNHNLILLAENRQLLEGFIKSDSQRAELGRQAWAIRREWAVRLNLAPDRFIPPPVRQETDIEQRDRLMRDYIKSKTAALGFGRQYWVVVGVDQKFPTFDEALAVARDTDQLRQQRLYQEALSSELEKWAETLIFRAGDQFGLVGWRLKFDSRQAAVDLLQRILVEGETVVAEFASLEETL
ncbi:MAG: hypothetical protein ACK4GK_07225 [Ferrovibrio sp.]